MKKSKFFYPILIFIIWLLTYIIYQIAFEQKLGWDEIAYLTVARGIVENFDFSSRTNTVMGLIKYAFPQHNHHYPLYSIYLAIFFKFFGTSLKVAYFSTWLSALVACLFIYFTLSIITQEDYLFSFILAVSFLFFPRITSYCDTAMMEIPGCALISFVSFLVFRDLSKGKLNPFLIAIGALWLFFFKSLFIGIIFGFFVLIVLAYNWILKSKVSLTRSLFSYSGTVVLLYFIFTKFIFLPLAPMMNFFPEQETPEGTYADFAGGFFHNPPGNLQHHIANFFQSVIFRYYPYIINFSPGNDAYYAAIPAWYELAIYFLTFFYVIVFLFLLWKKLLPIQKIFVLFTIISIGALNLAWMVVAGGGIGLYSRYNLVYVPLLLISSGIILKECLNYFGQFFLDYRAGSYFILLSFLVLVYLPFYWSSSLVSNWDKNVYHDIAHKNSEIVRKFTQGSNPMFIYFNVGQHTTWDLFPTKVVLMEATNKQIKEINKKLPKPIEFLFLTPKNNLFQENKDLILKTKPIIDNLYAFYNVDLENQVVVYKLNSGIK